MHIFGLLLVVISCGAEEKSEWSAGALACRLVGSGTLLELFAVDASVGVHVLRHCATVTWTGYSTDRSVTRDSRGLVLWKHDIEATTQSPTDWLLLRPVFSFEHILPLLRLVGKGVIVVRPPMPEIWRTKELFESVAFVMDDVACPGNLLCFRKRTPDVVRFASEPGLQYDAPSFPLYQQQVYTCVGVFMHCGGKVGGRGVDKARSQEVIAAREAFLRHTTESVLLHLFMVNEDDCPHLAWNETIRFRSNKKLGYTHLLDKIRGMVHYFQQVNTCNLVFSLGADIDVNLNWWQLARPKIPMLGAPLYMGLGASGIYAYGSMAAWNKGVNDLLLQSFKFAWQFEGSDDIMIGRLLHQHKDLLTMEWAPYIYGFSVCLPDRGCPSWIYKHDNERCKRANRTTHCLPSDGKGFMEPLEAVYRYPHQTEYDA